jgi:hypothetical protein
VVVVVVMCRQRSPSLITIFIRDINTTPVKAFPPVGDGGGLASKLSVEFLLLLLFYF